MVSGRKSFSSLHNTQIIKLQQYGIRYKVLMNDHFIITCSILIFHQIIFHQNVYNIPPKYFNHFLHQKPSKYEEWIIAPLLCNLRKKCVGWDLHIPFKQWPLKNLGTVCEHFGKEHLKFMPLSVKWNDPSCICPMLNFAQKDEILVISYTTLLTKFWNSAAMDVRLLRKFLLSQYIFSLCVFRFTFTLLLFFPTTVWQLNICAI